MRLSTITNTAYVITVLLSMIGAITMLLASAALETEREAVARRHVFDAATSELDIDIFHLSDKAREYVITGNEEYLEDYHAAMSVLTATEARLRDIQGLGATEYELATLEDAIRLADSLTNEQAEAIEAYRSGDAETARALLFSDHYEAELDLINNDVHRFQSLLDQRTGMEIARAEAVSRAWRTVSEIVLGLTALLFLGVLYFVLKRRILRPVTRLSDVVARLADQDYEVEISDFHHSDEIGDMAKAIGIFRQNGLERVRLEERLERDLRIRNLLARMTQRMQACENKEEVARIVSLFFPVIVPESPGRLYLFDSGENLMREASDWLAPKGSVSTFSALDCWALRRGTIHRQCDDGTDIPCQHISGAADPRADNDTTLPTLCVPLTAQREVIGLIYCETGTVPANSEQEQYLIMLAENVALSLSNIRLREELHKQAMADSLTGLANRRQLEHRLGSLLRDLERKGGVVSCLMLDVDHFKSFNDTYGHDVGDEVLRKVAAIMKSHTREDGLAFRYGGEEFVILLPGVGAEDAIRRAEAIRKDVAALRFEYRDSLIENITASFGVATAPENCAGEHMLTTADAALYQSKKNGRNQVSVASEPAASPIVA